MAKKKHICPTCGESVNKNDKAYLCEGACKCWFHIKCINISDDEYEKTPDDETWVCVSCTPKSNSGTPIKTPSNGKIKNPDSILTSLKSSKININKTSDISNKELANSINAILNALVDIQQGVSFLSDAHDDMIKSNKRIFDEFAKLSQDNKKLSEQNKDLSARLNKLEQACLENECEVHGLPQTENENLKLIAVLVCGKIAYKIDENDIDKIYRAKTHPSSSKKRPSPIIIKFKSSEIRNGFLAARKVHGNLTLNELGYQMGGLVHINERLTPINRNLLWLARNTKPMGYKYAWTKNGQVFLKKNEDAPAIHIRSAEDLPK
uniref:PHD-type domain-containing protein n=1 Tax=Lygus hesperus TaxID=30085 RepID=A0A0A9YPR7_LYGHE